MALRTKLCMEVTPTEEENDFRKVEKVLAPFLQTLKKRKHDKTNVLPAVHDELYLKRSPKDLLILLQNAFTDVIALKTLMNETAELLKVVTKSKSVNLYLTDYDRGDIMLCPKYYPRNDRFERRYPIESGTYLAAHVAFTKEYVISSDILGDVRFPLGIPDVPVVKSVICLPIITNVEENCIGVIELYRECSDKPYDLVNLQICNALTAWMGIAVEQNKARLDLIKNFKIRTELYDLTHLYFYGTVPFNRTVSDFLKLIKAAVNADRGAFYIFRETVLPQSEEVLIADTYEEGIDDFEDSLLYKKRTITRYVKNQPGIPGYAARTGEIINIQDAYKDHRFSRKSDAFLYRTRSIIAFPIKNENGVIAVLELINSLDYPCFRTEDINLVQSFLGYISIICEHFFLDVSYNQMKTRSLISDRLLDFYSKPPAEEVNMLKLFTQGEPQLLSGFFDFEWYTVFDEEEILRHIIYVFMSSDILEPYFEIQNLADFLLRIKRSYRPVFFHNFKHAFYTFHFTFITILRNKNVYTAVEIITMLLAALCHDVDHSGLSNSFLSLSNDPIYALYGDCCGEAHRYDLVFFLIQQTDLLSIVSDVTFHAIQKNLKKLILGFDLGVHFQSRRTITNLINSDSFDWDDPEHRLLSQNMILICSDYSVHLKNFEISKKYTDLFYKELYKQGDLEKSLGFSPLPMLNRKNVDSCAENQIILLSVVVNPVIELLIRLFPNLKILEKLFSDTMAQWNEFLHSQGQEMWKINQSLMKERRVTRRLRLSSTASSISTITSNEFRSLRLL